MDYRYDNIFNDVNIRDSTQSFTYTYTQNRNFFNTRVQDLIIINEKNKKVQIHKINK